jgi:hypothetical protein
MDQRLAQLEQAVADLGRALQDTNRRLVELEARASVGADGSTMTPRAVESAATAAGGTDMVALLSFAGRTCVVLGGAYLLRALTDAGTLPRAGGTALGFAYAVAWLVAAWRGPVGQRVASGVFHVIATVLIAFPLVWESTVRVQLLSQTFAAVAMAGVTALGLAVAWHRRVQALAWIVSSAGILAALALMAAAGSAGQPDAASGNAAAGGSAAPMTLYLAFLGVVTLWFAYRLDWTWLRWPVAIVADLSVLVMAWNATEVGQREQVGAVMLVQLVLFGGYLVSFTARTLWRSRRVVPFEVVQTLILLVVCFGGAVYLMLTTGTNATALGVVSLVFGAGSYAAAFAFIDWRRGHWTNFVFYASLGVVFTVAGTALVVAAPVQAIAWALLALVTASGGKRYGTITLSSHATIYVIAGAVASGLLVHATKSLTASAAGAWAPLILPAVAVLAAAALSSAVPLSGANESWGRCSRVPKVVLVVVLLWSAGGVLCGLLAPLLAGQPGTSAADVAIVASVRTVILAGSVLLLAWAGRGVFVEGRWLSYVVLVAGGIKLLVEDFPNGRPSTLFLSLAVYGGALILGPRLRAPTRDDAPRPSSRVEPV